MPLKVVTLAMVAALTALGMTAPAHHAHSMFDMSKCESLTGTVQTFQFQYPHSWLWVATTNAKGEPEVWGFETASPPQMREVEPRWSRDVVHKGDKVSIKYSPMRDGRTGGSLGWLTLPSGVTLRAATPGCMNGGYLDPTKGSAQ